MEYNKICELFEPIFQWIKENYPNGAYFLVDKNSAKLYAEENIAVYSKEITDCVKNFMQVDIDNKNFENKSECLFTLNKDLLGGNKDNSD